jgi:SOS response regulatory protein OraA/RecX
LDRNVGKKAVSLALLRQRCEARGANAKALALLDEGSEPLLEALLAKYEQTPKGRDRAARFLISRGFDEDAVETVIARHFNFN